MSEEEAVEGEPSETPAEVADGAAEETSASSADAEAGDESASTGDEPASTLVDRVGEHDEALAREVAELEAALESSREETSELTSKLARVRADFSNYKERAKRKREEIRERASEALVEKVVPVRNDLLRALDQEEGSDIRPGVESTLEKFDEVLTEEGVDPIRPEPGDEVDPNRHQVMLRVESEQPNGTIHEVYEPGYEMGDRVLTEAQVTVSADDDA